MQKEKRLSALIAVSTLIAAPVFADDRDDEFEGSRESDEVAFENRTAAGVVFRW